MPLYDYVCDHCGHRFEVIHGVHAVGPADCPACGGGPVRKAVSAAAVHYKGSGWAKKDRSTSRRTAKDGDAAAATAAKTESGGPGATTTEAGGSDGGGGSKTATDGGGSGAPGPTASGSGSTGPTAQD